jgi:hypothetical protein
LEINFMWTVVAGFHIPQMKHLLPATDSEGVSIGLFIEHLENAGAFGAAANAVNTLLTSALVRHHLIIPARPTHRVHQSHNVHTAFIPSPALMARCYEQSTTTDICHESDSAPTTDATTAQQAAIDAMRTV